MTHTKDGEGLKVLQEEVARFEQWLEEKRKPWEGVDEEFTALGFLDRGDWETYQSWKAKIRGMVEVLGLAEDELGSISPNIKNVLAPAVVVVGMLGFDEDGNLIVLEEDS